MEYALQEENSKRDGGYQETQKIKSATWFMKCQREGETDKQREIVRKRERKRKKEKESDRKKVRIEGNKKERKKKRERKEKERKRKRKKE